LKAARAATIAEYGYHPMVIAALSNAANSHAEAVADACAAMNPRFSRSRFLAASGHSAYAEA
jgi:hypothetical protein